jgi:glutaredoxin 3
LPADLAQAYHLIRFSSTDSIASLGSPNQLCYTCREGLIASIEFKGEGGEELGVVIYTKPGCPYCQKAREFYTGQGIKFEDRNAQDNLKYRKEMLSLNGSDPTVPTIVENGKLKQVGWEGRG